MTSIKFGFVLIAVFVARLACAEIEPYAKPEALTPGEDFREVLAKVAPNVYISGQPTPEGLARAKALGVTRVINLRTQGEMDDREVVDFDEQARAKELALDYVQIPSGGPDTPYSPDLVKAFATAVDNPDGSVLLHCTVAFRATHMWTAYLIDYLDMPVPEALEIARQLNLGTMPLEGYLGRKLVIGVAREE